jgi:hypothetical protein
MRNPYRREFLIKKLFGKTKEERVKFKQDKLKWIEEHKKEIDIKEMGLEEQE